MSRIPDGQAKMIEQLRADLARAERACVAALPIVAGTCNALGETCSEADANALALLREVCR